MSELMAIDLSEQMIHSKFKRVELARIYSPTSSEAAILHIICTILYSFTYQLYTCSIQP